MRNLNNLRIFARVAEVKNFTQAAQRMNLTASAVSKAVTSLELDLGVRLFNRTTRSVNLTTDGASFLESCESILAQIEEAEAGLNSTRTSLRGRIRLQVPITFGRRVVVPALQAFCRHHPNIIIDAEMTSRVIDLVYEAVDIAIVVGPVMDDRLIARKLCDLQFSACASPGYIRRHGQPMTPDDLAQHRCLAYVIPQSGRYREWKFQKDGRSYSKIVSGQLNMNNAESLLQAAISGAGIVMLSTFVTADAVRAGKLKVVLCDYVSPGPPVWAVYLPNRNLSPRIRVFLDFLQQLIPRNRSW